MSDQEIDKLRALMVASPRDGRRAFPDDLRQRLQDYLKRRWESGESVTRVASELGISRHTATFWRSRWGERKDADRQLRRVEIISEKPSATEISMALILHGPGGTRLEGVSRHDVIEIWRKLS